MHFSTSVVTLPPTSPQNLRLPSLGSFVATHQRTAFCNQTASHVCEPLAGSQVKAHEEKFIRQNEHLQAQLQEALSKQNSLDQISSGIQIDTPAEKTLKFLDRLLTGSDINMNEVQELRNVLMTVRDVHLPVDLTGQLEIKGEQLGGMDTEVKDSLVQLLGSSSRCDPEVRLADVRLLPKECCRPCHGAEACAAFTAEARPSPSPRHS